MSADWSNLDMRLGTTSRNVWEPGLTHRPTWYRWASDLILWYVASGRGRIRTRGGKVEMRRGVCLCLAPGWDYEASQDPRRPLTTLAIHFELIDHRGHLLPNDHRIVPERLHVPDVPYLHGMIERLIDLTHGICAARPVFHPDRLDIAAQLFRGLLMDLCAASQGAQAVAPGTQRYQHDLMIDAVRRMTDNPRRVPRVFDLARQCGYSVPHFSRVFKRVIGQSPKAFLTARRIDIARQLLVESDLTIGEIAGNLGFDNVVYFSRLFRLKGGMTASEFRRAAGR